MVPELARMSVVIKSQHETSVMTETMGMAYACGLLCRLAGAALPEWTQAKELQEKTLELLKSYAPADDREKMCSTCCIFIIRMIMRTGR
ncbi:MAG: DUF3837 family protein [Eisenbergiella sp.]